MFFSKCSTDMTQRASSISLEVLLPLLRQRNIEQIYIDVVTQQKPLFYFKKQTKPPTVNVSWRGIQMYADSIQTAIVKLTEYMLPFDSPRYTKFSYYLKLYVTAVALVTIKHTNIKLYNQAVVYPKYSATNTLYNLPREPQCIDVLLFLKKTITQLLQGIDRDAFSIEVATAYEQKYKLPNFRYIWMYWFDNFIKISSQTLLREVFPNMKNRAYNNGIGEKIHITLRSSVDPLQKIINREALVPLLIHELAHTLAPVITNSKNITFSTSEKNIKVFLSTEDPHGIRFQYAHIYLASQAYKLGILPYRKQTYDEYEIALRKAFQDESIGILVDLKLL